MIRLILAGTLVGIFLILGIPLLIIYHIIGLINKPFADRISLHTVQSVFRGVSFLSGIELIVNGKENVPKDGAVLYVPNHLSIFDVVVLYPLVKDCTGFVAKKSVKKIPLLRDWMNALHCLFLDRSDIRAGMQMILDAIENVKNGISMVIFPEGTRSKDGDVGEFHAGSFKIATRTDCPIVPVAINNTDAVMLHHKPFIKPAKVVVTFLPPVYSQYLSPEDKKHVSEYVRRLIDAQVKKDRELYYS